MGRELLRSVDDHNLQGIIYLDKYISMMSLRCCCRLTLDILNYLTMTERRLRRTDQGEWHNDRSVVYHFMLLPLTQWL